MHCISNPYPAYTLKKGHQLGRSYCKDQLIKDSIDLRNKYGAIPEKQPLEIRRCNVLGYSNKRRNEAYKSQIFFEAPDFVSQKKKPTQRPMSSYVARSSNQPKPKSESTESQIGSISYQDQTIDSSPVKITIKLKAEHTEKQKLKKFQDKLTIKELGNNMVEVSGLVPLKIANLFKTIFQNSEFHQQRVSY